MTRIPVLSAVSAIALAAGLVSAAAQDVPDNDPALDIPSFAEREPEVTFPTCVGIARIDKGAVTQIPIGEGALWDEQFDMLGEAVGRQVDVLSTATTDPARAVAELRAEAAADGLDWLVIYELAYDADEDTGPTAIQELTIFPTFEGEQTTDPARAAGAAILLDVAGGAMYGVASAITFNTELDTPAPGYFATEEARAAAFNAVVTELAHEVETAFVGLMIKAGLPEPRNFELEAAAGDLTEDQIIAQADQAFRASYGDEDRGC